MSTTYDEVSRIIKDSMENASEEIDGAGDMQKVMVFMPDADVSIPGEELTAKSGSSTEGSQPESMSAFSIRKLWWTAGNLFEQSALQNADHESAEFLKDICEKIYPIVSLFPSSGLSDVLAEIEGAIEILYARIINEEELISEEISRIKEFHSKNCIPECYETLCVLLEDIFDFR